LNGKQLSLYTKVKQEEPRKCIQHRTILATNKAKQMAIHKPSTLHSTQHQKLHYKTNQENLEPCWQSNQNKQIHPKEEKKIKQKSYPNKLKLKSKSGKSIFTAK
jgi:hypothetical protein